jgi:HAD superfamily hydrolase (TIGR01509 family)
MQVMHDLLRTRLAPMPGLLDFLTALAKANFPSAIATSSGREFLDAVLAQSGLAGRFAFTVAGNEIEHGKPAPDIYLLAAERHGCRPQQVLVLEDSQIGCRAAVAADTYAVAVPSGHSHTHEFPGAKFVADTLADERIYRVLHIARC